MKPNFILASFAVLGIFAGCSKAADEIPAVGDKISFTVLNEDSKTSGISTISFNSGDLLSVFDSGLANNKFSQAESGSGATKEYTGTITASSTADYVVYPYNENSSIAADGTLTVPIPAHYAAAANNNSILRGMNLSVGVPDAGGAVSLKNVFGIVGVNIPLAVAYNISNVKLSADQVLAGTVSFKYNGGEPEVTGIADGSTSVDFGIKINTTTQLPSSGSYYFCIKPGTYTGLKLTITLQNGNTVELTSSKTLTVTRNSRTMLKNIALSDIQSAPAGEVTLSLDFSSESVLYKIVSGSPEAMSTTGSYLTASSASGAKPTPVWYYFDQGGITYPIIFTGLNFTVSSEIKRPSVKYFNSSPNALMMQNGGACLITPTLPGKKLSQFRFAHGNSASSKDITKSIVIFNKVGQNGATLASSYPANVASSTRPAGGSPAFSDWVDVTAAAETPMYIYQTQAASNTCINKLELKYVDAE